MELHHSKHHATYVSSYNAFSEKLAAAQSASDIASQIALQPMINFHGGGHVNHSLFWENLAPRGRGGGEPPNPSGGLMKALQETWGGVDGVKKVMNATLAGVQGSGWAWLVKDRETGRVGVRSYAVSLSGGLGLVRGKVGVEWRGRGKGKGEMGIMD